MIGSTTSQVNELNLNSIFRGKVISNADPKKEGRLQIYIPSLSVDYKAHEEKVVEKVKPLTVSLFENKEEITYSSTITETNVSWFRPCAWLIEKTLMNTDASGSYKVPKAGTVLSVYYENGDPNKPYWLPFSPSIDGEVIEGLNIGVPFGTEGTVKSWVDEVLKPNVHVIVEEKSGTIIFIDDNEASRCVSIYMGGFEFSMYNGTNKGINLSTPKGNLIRINEDQGSIAVRTAGGNSIVANDGDGSVSLANSGGATTTMKGNNITHKAGIIQMN